MPGSIALGLSNAPRVGPRAELTILFERGGTYSFLCPDCFEELAGLYEADLMPPGGLAAEAIHACACWQRARGGCQWCSTRYETAARTDEERKEVHDAAR